MLSLQTCPLQNPPYILHCFKAPPPSLSVCVNGTPSWFLPWGNTVCMLLSVSSTSSLPGRCWCLIYNCSYTFPLCPPSKKKKKLVPVQKSWQQQRISGTKFWTLTLTRYCNFLLQGRSGFSLLAGQHWWMWCRVGWSCCSSTACPCVFLFALTCRPGLGDLTGLDLSQTYTALLFFLFFVSFFGPIYWIANLIDFTMNL